MLILCENCLKRNLLFIVPLHLSSSFSFGCFNGLSSIVLALKHNSTRIALAVSVGHSLAMCFIAV
jgi:hypothetical protein